VLASRASSTTVIAKKQLSRVNTISVTLDTEEEGLWGGAYPVRNCTTENLRGLSRFQNLCEKYSIPPTYLIDAPVLEDQLAVNQLRSWQDSRLCEVGAHCHPWCNPPIASDIVSESESYLCNLPVELQYQKLEWLTHRISDFIGRRPTSYRAGRYGFNASSIGPLVQLGYTVDSSVLPAYDYSKSHGPDFTSSDRFPSRLQCKHGGHSILEFPITTGFTRSNFYGLRQQLRKLVETPLGRATKLASISNRLGLSRHVKLSPEGTTLVELQGLVKSSVLSGVKHLVLMLHSTSLLPGFSPYAKDGAAVESLYERMERIFEYATKSFDCEGCTLFDLSNRNDTLAIRTIRQ